MIGCIINLMLLSSPIQMPEMAAAELSSQMIELPGELTEVIYLDEKGNLVQRGYMIDGKKTGTWITYNAKGEITAKANYENGEKQGKWKIYNNAGELEYKICYKNNKKVWAQQYNTEGELTAFTYK
ncbi:MAG: hypothetical protein KBF42_05845 [Chitinophagales bacterium]|nr:hypothetical protein [Bacteroidota bacterium]MBK7568537.1 hypothetical protein [Bacteroidota bacterium]MBP8915358.1 hypothetical protein [Chitinophagales bacterium]MBP9220884.1 hypothetical protein [Chitinophagales bacterium]MBP9795354.1 hypothetical protein [Chitinophagales bacterium]